MRRKALPASGCAFRSSRATRARKSSCTGVKPMRRANPTARRTAGPMGQPLCLLGRRRQWQQIAHRRAQPAPYQLRRRMSRPGCLEPMVSCRAYLCDGWKPEGLCQWPARCLDHPPLRSSIAEHPLDKQETAARYRAEGRSPIMSKQHDVFDFGAHGVIREFPDRVCKSGCMNQWRELLRDEHDAVSVGVGSFRLGGRGFSRGHERGPG